MTRNNPPKGAAAVSPTDPDSTSRALIEAAERVLSECLLDPENWPPEFAAESALRLLLAADQRREAEPEADDHLLMSCIYSTARVLATGIEKLGDTPEGHLHHAAGLLAGIIERLEGRQPA